MLNRAEAAPSSATPNQNHSALGDRIQSRPPAAVVAFPVRSSNIARACIAALDVSPAVRLTGYAIADCAAIHPRSTTFRHIQEGDCAAFPAGETIRRTRRGRVTIRTIRNHIEALVIAGLERRRTIRTNTYVFTHPEQQKAPGIRAEIAENCTLLSNPDSDCTPDFTPKEPLEEGRKDLDQDQDQKNRARDPSTATTTTTATTGVRTTTTTTTGVSPDRSTGRDPGPACAPETSPPPRDPSTTTTTTTTTAVRTDADSTGRDPGPACAPETSPPPARRTPANDKPATARQLEYVRFLADEVSTDPPNPATLTARTADRVIRDLTARYAPRRERRDRRRQPVPSTVQAQSDRTDRTEPIHGCSASARRARIDVLTLTIEQWQSRTDPATVQAWKHELAQLIAEDDRHREGLRPPPRQLRGRVPPGNDMRRPPRPRRQGAGSAGAEDPSGRGVGHDWLGGLWSATGVDPADDDGADAAAADGADDLDPDPDPDAAAIRRCPISAKRAAFAARSPCR